jgi:hypothetical protein
MFSYTKLRNNEGRGEAGFVLVLAMVILLLLSSLGLWALQTSISELQVAGGSQQFEKQFNVTEGGAYVEAGKLGFFSQDFYQIADPADTFQLLIPTTDNDSGATGDFDPGDDTATTLTTIAAQANGYTGGLVPLVTWPRESMIQDYANPSTNDEFDYRYLTTYLYAATAPVGYDASSFGAYKFTIQSAAALRPLIVELGGTKIGPK